MGCYRQFGYRRKLRIRTRILTRIGLVCTLLALLALWVLVSDLMVGYGQ